MAFSMTYVLLGVCLVLAFAFEFVNGFHDTANAVATVIYTRSLPARVAVVLSGLCNFLGVFLGGVAVAFGIVNLLPAEVLAGGSSGLALAMVLSLLLSAIIWNVGTWYLGLPSSSSHTLIGSILGVGLAHSMLPGHHFGQDVNWSKATDIGAALLVSPLVGFTLAAILLLIMRKVFSKTVLHDNPTLAEKPPFLVRAILTLTCSGVSFAHGSNDGQKGIGLVMLILISILPAQFALRPDASPKQINAALVATAKIDAVAHNAEIVAAKGVPAAEPSAAISAVSKAYAGNKDTSKVAALYSDLNEIRDAIAGGAALPGADGERKVTLRSKIMAVQSKVNGLQKAGFFSAADGKTLKAQISALRDLTDFAPTWVLIAVAFSLGLGTMIGWKRIVVTVGSKIGKEHLNYAQGMSAEIVAMGTIGLAATAGLPVSTTHVLSSGIAGTMVAHKSGLQGGTVGKILSAWVLTLPVSMLLAGSLFYLLRLFIA
jgi:PiT family inorganic phosphate transporter